MKQNRELSNRFIHIEPTHFLLIFTRYQQVNSMRKVFSTNGAETLEIRGGGAGWGGGGGE